MIVEDVLHNLIPSQRFAYRFTLRICVSVVLHLETENVIVGDSVRDSVLVQALLEHVLCCNVFCLLAIDTGVAAVFLENRSSGKAE